MLAGNVQSEALLKPMLGTVDGGNLAPLLHGRPVARDFSRWMEEILHRRLDLLQNESDANPAPPF